MLHSRRGEAALPTAAPKASFSVQAFFRVWCVALAIGLWVIPSAPPVQAQETRPSAVGKPASVEDLYEAGKAALRAKKPAEAVTHFKSALANSDGRASITWQMLLAVAVAYKDLGYPVHTLEYFQRFVDLTAPHQEVASEKWQRRHAKALQDIAELEKALAMTYGFVAVTSTPPGAQVSVDGRPAGADEDAVTPFRLILTPGAHTLALSLDGHERAERALTVSAGARTEAEVALAAVAPPVTEPRGPVDRLETSEGLVTASLAPAESGGSIGPWIVLGGGGAIGVVGVVMSILAADEEDAMKGMVAGGKPSTVQAAGVFTTEWREHGDALDTYNTVSGVMFGLSLGALAGGLIWGLVDDDSAPDEPEAPPAVTLTPTEGGVFGRATWRF